VNAMHGYGLVRDEKNQLLVFIGKRMNDNGSY